MSDPATSWKKSHLKLYMWSLSTHLDDNYKLRLKERGVYRRIHDRSTGLKWLEKVADVPTGRKIGAEKDLMDLREVTFSK